MAPTKLALAMIPNMQLCYIIILAKNVVDGGLLQQIMVGSHTLLIKNGIVHGVGMYKNITTTVNHYG